MSHARKTFCIDKRTCGCVIGTSYGLPCACFIAMKIRHNKPIRMDEIHPHWHKLYMGEEESNEDLFSIAGSGVVFKNVSKEFHSK